MVVDVEMAKEDMIEDAKPGLTLSLFWLTLLEQIQNLSGVVLSLTWGLTGLYWRGLVFGEISFMNFPAPSVHNY